MTSSSDSRSGPSDLWENVEESETPEAKTPRDREKSTSPKLYHPLLDTLRLYAGWLLALYVLTYALGAYQMTRTLPFEIPFVRAYLPPYSPLLFAVTLGLFLFLLLTTVHRNFGKKKGAGGVLAVIGVVVFVWYRMNV